MSVHHYRGRFLHGVLLFLRVLVSYKLFALRHVFSPVSLRQSRIKRLHARNARMLRETMIKQRGMFIKIGQFLSSRVDLLPEEYTDELSKLQDQVPPAPFSEIEKRVVQELGPLNKVFSSFDEVPIASASLGQVHRACLTDGDCIVVKVQYPGIDEVIEADSRTLYFVTRIMKRLYKDINFDVIYSEFSRVIREELDYLQEGRNAESFARNFANNPKIRIPIVYWPFTTRKVLTLEYLDGIKINDLDAIEAAGIDKKEAGRIIAEAYSQMFFVDGLFHGDPHPGNIFVRPGPEVVLVDFGMVDRIRGHMREGLQRAFAAVVASDSLGLVRALVDMGFIPLTKDIRPLVQFVDRLLTKYRSMSPAEFKAMDIDEIGRDIQEAVQLNPSIQIPNDFILFGRVVGMLNGLGSRLDPETNIIEIAAPFAKRFIKADDFTPRGLMMQAGSLARTLVKLPGLLETFLVTTGRGETRVEITSHDIVRELHGINRLGRGFISAILTVGAGGAAVLFRLGGFDREALWSAGATGILLLMTLLFMRKERS